jgi:hypothetical protein
MIKMITGSTPRPEYEAFLSPFFPEGRLPPPPPPSRRRMWDLLKRKNPTQKAIDALPLGDLAKTTLRRWSAAQSQGDSLGPFFIPERDFLQRLDYLERMHDLPRWKFAEVILERAGSSPMGVKIHRLIKS